MIRLIDHQVQLEPIDQWPGKRTGFHQSSPFKADLRDTEQLLNRELSMLRAKRVVMQMEITRADLRIDGSLRSGRRIHRPGVILRFDSKHGPVTMPCDKFPQWEDNLRAIALGLEALRKVDRYGISATGEQYRGWQALPGPAPNSVEAELPTVDDAIAFLRKLVSAFRAGEIGAEEALRKAEFLTHPDKGGDPLDFKRVQRCRELLR